MAVSIQQQNDNSHDNIIIASNVQQPPMTSARDWLQ